MECYQDFTNSAKIDRAISSVKRKRKEEAQANPRKSARLSLQQQQPQPINDPGTNASCSRTNPDVLDEIFVVCDKVNHYYTDRIDLKRKCQSLTKTESLDGALLKQAALLKEDESMKIQLGLRDAMAREVY